MSGILAIYDDDSELLWDSAGTNMYGQRENLSHLPRGSESGRVPLAKDGSFSLALTVGVSWIQYHLAALTQGCPAGSPRTPTRPLK